MSGPAHALIGRKPTPTEMATRAGGSGSGSGSGGSGSSSACGSPTGQGPLVKHGGGVIAHAHVTDVHWGAVTDAGKLDDFARWLAPNFYVQNLGAEFPGIGAGSFARSVTSGAAKGTVTKGDVETNHSWYSTGFWFFGVERHHLVVPDRRARDRCPRLDAWHSDDPDKDEIGDLCNGFNVQPNIFKSPATDDYWVQCEYSNASRGRVDTL